MPVQLKYSYRFLNGDRKIALGQLRNKRVHHILKLKDNDCDDERIRRAYSDAAWKINIIEHDGYFVSQKESFMLNTGYKKWSSWLRKQKPAETALNFKSIYELSDGKRSLLEISRKSGIVFTLARKLTEEMLKAGFLKEISRPNLKQFLK